MVMECIRMAPIVNPIVPDPMGFTIREGNRCEAASVS